MANKVTIDVEARFVDSVTDESKAASKAIEGIGKEAGKAQKEVDSLGKKKVKPLFDADNNKFLNKIRKMEEKMAKMGRTKTAAVLDLVDKATTKIGKVMNKVQAFAGKTWQGVLKFKDSQALESIKKITSGVENITKKTWTALVKVKDLALSPIRAIKNALFSIPTLITAVVGAKIVQKGILEPINLADQYSGAKIGFSTLLGESAGQAMMDEIDLFAKKTPFKTSGVISNVQKMMAYGWDVDRVIKDMEIIGDAAAATGKGDQGLETIVYALSEIRSKGKLSTQELNQLASAGIKAKAYLAKGLGFGTDDAGMKKLAEALEDGAIGANQAIDLILEGMKEFDGMMDATANETVEGLKSQIEDAFEINVLRRWGQGLQDGAKKGFGSIVNLLDKADGALSRFGDTLYELGSVISNWVAEKLKNVIERINEITSSFEFKNADLGGKISMLWQGVIADPLTEWWNNGGREKTAEAAGKIGRWIGEMLTKGLLAIFGATEVLKDIDGADVGGSVAGSFVQGFLQSFDAGAVTQAFVDAICNVWNALPTWGKILVGGYVGGKATSFLGNIVGGLGNIKNFIGSRGVWEGGKVVGSSGLLGFIGRTGYGTKGPMAGTGVLGGLSKLGYGLVGKMGSSGALSAAGMSGGVAAGAGAGALAMGAGLIKSGMDFYGAIQAHQQGNTVTRDAKITSGAVTLGAMGAGAGIGSIFGPAGTLIGGGIGAVVGWLGGDAIARNMEAARYSSEAMQEAVKSGEKSQEELNQEFEKAKWEIAVKKFGDISLSLEEIQRLSDQIVWGDDLVVYEKMAAATKAAEENLQAMKNASADADKWLWKAGLGVKFNEDERIAIQKTFDEYLSAAQANLENRHYEFQASADLLLDMESEGGKSILESGNAFFMAEQAELDAAGKELGEELIKALADGIINADEEEAIVAIQGKIAEITNKINDAKSKAELDLIKSKWGDGNLDYESFETFMETMDTNLENRMATLDEAYTTQLTNLRLRYPDGGTDFENQQKVIIEGYNKALRDVKDGVKDVELSIVADAFDLKTEELEAVISHCMEKGITPVGIDPAEFIEIIDAPYMKDDVSASLQDIMEQIFNQVYSRKEMFEGWSAAYEFPTTVTPKVTFEEPKQFLPETDITDYFMDIYGIPDSLSKDVRVLINPELAPIPKFGLGASNFGIKSFYTFGTMIGINARLGSVKTTGKDILNHTYTDGSGYRGGIFGGSSAMEGFARGGRPDDGMLDGSTRFIRVNEESPEMIIPLSSQRRGRALKLWAKAGNLMGVPGFARGGITSGGADEGIRFNRYDGEGASGGHAVQVDVGGITFEINVNGNDSQSITEAIKAQAAELAETVAGVLADALGAQFENTPARGGVA